MIMIQEAMRYATNYEHYALHHAPQTAHKNNKINI